MGNCGWICWAIQNYVSLFVVSFYLMNILSPSRRSGRLVFPSVTFLWEKHAGFLPCFFFFLLSCSFSSSYFLPFFFFFLSTTLWKRLLSFGCLLTRDAAGGFIFLRSMFTRLKLTCDSLGSSVSSLLLATLLLWPPNLRLTPLPPPAPLLPVRAVFYSSVVFFYVSNVGDFRVARLASSRNVFKVVRVDGSRCCLADCPCALERASLDADDGIGPALHSLLCNWASLVTWNCPRQAASHLVCSSSVLDPTGPSTFHTSST